MLPDKKGAYEGTWIGIVAFLLVLVFLEKEGLLCGILATILAAPLIYLGYKITHWIKRSPNKQGSDSLPVLILPLLVFLFGAPFEHILTPGPSETMAVKSERIYPYSCKEVYDAIKSIDTLAGVEKPFLMLVDLPVPQKCVLDTEAIGGIRTCYFEGGRIVEKITQLERGKVLKMDVTSYEVMGRKWLGFKEAIYEFDSVGVHQCKMTRITTYTSELKPRVYWEPLERLGIETEHRYVFDNLAHILAGKARR
jgi:hypothetical protein